VLTVEFRHRWLQYLIGAFALLSALLMCTAACADEALSVCYNYGCASASTVRFTEAQLTWVKRTLALADSAAAERESLSVVIGKLYFWAGQQSPIYADRGGNLADNAVNGAMDCIDHSTTTTRLLNMIDARGWLRYHAVLEPVRRVHFFMFQHFSAAIEETPPWLPGVKIEEHPEAPDEATPDRFVVDSWFVNNGQPAVILPLEAWKSGGGPSVEAD